MRKALLVLVLLVAMTGFATAADLSGFHSSPTDRAIGYIGFASAGQAVTLTYSDSTPEAKILLGESGLAFSSIQIWGDGGEGMFNFFSQESFAYMMGGSFSVNGTSETITDAAGYFFSALLGASTNIPTFVDGLEIMVGLGYHMDCGYAAMTYGTNDLTGLLDLSLAGIGLNLVADWALLGEIGLSFIANWTIDLWGLTLPLAGFSTTVDTLVTNPGMNLEIAIGVSIPNEIAEEFETASY